MDKSLGEIAYNAYATDTGWKSLVSGAQLPVWQLLSEAIREAWEAAAHAVLEQVATEGA
jgi:hypothetical protein